MFCVNFWNSLSFYCFCFLHYISNIFGCCRSFLNISFMFLFESSVSFVFRIDLLATRKTIIAVVFRLFSGSYCFLSVYTYLNCAAKLVLFGDGLSSARRWDEKCEVLRVFELRIFFYHYQVLQVLSCQIKTTHCPLPM